jgi:O-acetylserine/cysteine efflux transporter
MTPRDVAIASFVMLVWGVNFVVAKVGLAQFPPILMMALRFALVAAVLVPFVRRPAAPMTRVLGLGFTLGALHFALFFSGLKGIDASVAAIVIQLQVPFAVMLSAVFLGDRPGPRRILGTVLAFAGVFVIFAGAPVPETYLPLILMLCAAFVWSLANFQIKALGNVDGMSLNGWVALFAVPQLLVASLVLENGQWSAIVSADWRGYASIAFMALFSTILGYGLWYRLIHKYPMSLAMPFTLLAPVIAVISGIVILGEPLTPRLVLGSLMTLGGVAIIVLRRAPAIAALEPVE